MVEDDTTELMDYAKELKLLEEIRELGDLIKSRIEITNHWLHEILLKLSGKTEDQQKVSKEPEIEELKIDTAKDTEIEKTVEIQSKTDVSIKPMTKIKVESVRVLENSYMIKNGLGQVAFVGKSLVKSATGDTLFLTDAAQHWFTADKIKWKKDDR